MAAEYKQLKQLQEFAGCDGGDPGSASSPSTWIFGIEHGTFKSRNDPSYLAPQEDEKYSVDLQLTWPYNRNAFKLLAAIEGRPVAEYVDFANERQPFVAGAKGYFKGNLYPFACRRVEDWPAVAKAETGMTKNEYKTWCQNYHFPAISSWVSKYQPKLFIGVGIMNRNEFSQVFLGDSLELHEHQININGHVKRIFHAESDGRVLVVIPHLSGSRHGLNSDHSLQQAGQFIRQLIDPSSCGIVKSAQPS